LLSIFFNCTSTSPFTGGTFSWNLNIFHEYLVPPLIERPESLPHVIQLVTEITKISWAKQ
jgi:hypothetical protein